MIYTFDFEVLEYDWIVVFKNFITSKYSVFHNDNDAVAIFLDSDDEILIGGFNNKHYDNYILKGVLAGFTPGQLVQINDYIIKENGNGWECPFLKDVQTPYIDSFDVKDDMQDGLSLKAIEGHLGMNICESSIPFDIDRPLTKDELAELIEYCKHDVDATEKIFKLRQGYYKGKVSLAKMGGLTEQKGMFCTNAKLTALFLKARKQEYDDERKYVYPENLLTQYIPQEVFDYFNRMYDSNLSDDEVYSEKLNLTIGNTPVVIGYGGIHAAIPKFTWQEGEDEDIIRNWDVASYYPSLMIVNGYTSRSIPSPEHFASVYHRRIAAKRSGDKATANTLKLLINTTYGATLDKFNDLYDPLQARSVCISGQLYLLELAEHLAKEIDGLTIVQLNTDGLMLKFTKTHYNEVVAITDEWQKRTGFGLEEDVITRISQKDVNNYCMIDGDGHEKLKGGYLVRGLAEAGAFKINNNEVAVAEAIKEYLLYDVPVEETILKNADDPSKFQTIAKAGSSYEKVMWGDQEVQRCNRVFASRNQSLPNLIKFKPDGSSAKIQSLPEHCVIWNDTLESLDAETWKKMDIDYDYYIEMAKKRINDYLTPKKKGLKKKMATATAKSSTPTNVWQKLAQARLRFMQSGVKKTGKNMFLKYTYFTLDDIVPVALPIMTELGLIPVFRPGVDNMVMDIIDMDDPNNPITIWSPMPQLGAMEQLTPIQELGANLTYIRRYLWMLALEITENDMLDESTGKDSAPASKKPVAPEVKAEIKKDLTDTKNTAPKLQVDRLKKAMKRLLEKQPDKTEAIEAIMEETNNLENITKKACDQLMIKIGEMIEEGAKENGTED